MREPIEARFPRPSVMGVVNVTPDSFSDGGVNFAPHDAISSARRMLDDGAAIVDVGGESTRPGAEGVSQGIREELICLDPGIGFGKTVDHNFELIRRLDELVAIGRPIVVGISRKSSLGKLMGDPDAKTGTTAASVGAAVAAYERGAAILRVHDVREHVEALRAAQPVASPWTVR